MEQKKGLTTIVKEIVEIIESKTRYKVHWQFDLPSLAVDFIFYEGSPLKPMVSQKVTTELLEGFEPSDITVLANLILKNAFGEQLDD